MTIFVQRNTVCSWPHLIKCPRYISIYRWFAMPSTLSEIKENLNHGHKNMTEKKHNPKLKKKDFVVMHPVVFRVQTFNHLHILITACVV
jgi:hypothetical protein